MQIFGRTAGYYMFWTGFVYFFTSMFNVFVYKFVQAESIHLVWILVLMLPLTVKPLARYFNMKLIWEK